MFLLMESAPLKLQKSYLLQQLTAFPFPFESTEAVEAAPLHVAWLAHCFVMAVAVSEQHTDKQQGLYFLH